MNLTDTEKKLLILAMDKGAGDGEVQAAATKFFRSLRERYPSGHELIKELMKTGTSMSAWAEQQARQAAAQRPTPQQQEAWNDIMRQAKAAGQAYAAREAERRAYERAKQQQYSGMAERIWADLFGWPKF